MRILFLHSGSELTGSVTYAQALAEAWEGRHEVFWAGDRPFGHVDSDHFLRVPLSEKLLPHGVQHIPVVDRFIRDHKIDILHAHSRRANCIAAFCSQWTGVPYVTTAHMRMQPHVWNRVLGCWGQRTVAICENIALHLQDVNRIPARQIVRIANGIDFIRFRPQPEYHYAGARRITVIGRLSGHRWRAAAFILSLLPDLFRYVPEVHVRFIGSIDPAHAATFQAQLDALNTGGATPRVSYLGFASDVRPFIAESDAVVGAGRSLLEAMAMEIPGISVGEESAHGLLTPENFENARMSNFGDFATRDRGDYDRAIVLEGLKKILSRSTDLTALKAWGRVRLMRDYDLRNVAAGVEQVYLDVLNENPRHPLRLAAPPIPLPPIEHAEEHVHSLR